MGHKSPFDCAQGRQVTSHKYNGVIERYKKYLPVTNKTPIITLNEGNTPLIYAGYLSKLFGKNFEVYLKYEGLNPTGSFKDRGMTLAVSKACEEGSRAIMCASTGNTSASAAAYASRAGIKCIVLIPRGAIALGKLSQALIHGAVVLAVDGNF
ncbi:MAG: pyridoxal-phosphate dependent enzyme, partial [Candidatus Omnitrophica bacterium]|nr:pyridoxal-phosphate dependent enzyme [Candidatus Omnitrophota bacterium]